MLAMLVVIEVIGQCLSNKNRSNFGLVVLAIQWLGRSDSELGVFIFQSHGEPVGAAK